MPESERVADGHHPVAGFHLRRVAETGLRQRIRRPLGQLDEGTVGEPVSADDAGLIQLVIVEEGHLDLGGALDDMIVRDDIAVLVDDEPGARRHCGAFL